MNTPNEPETTQIDTSKLVSPNEDASKEGTPIGDALAQETATVDEDDTDAEELSEEAAPGTAKAYKVDVARALERETHDGKGDEDPGPSDWVSFATEGVEKEAGQ